MAVAQMDHITVYGMKQDRKRILDALQRIGVVEVSDAEPVEGFELLNTIKARGIFEKTIGILEQALDVLESYVPEEHSVFAMLEGRKKMTFAEYEERLSGIDKVLDSAKGILQAEKEKADFQGEIQRRENLIAQLRPWEKLDIPMTYTGTKKTATLVGVFSELLSTEMILQQYREQTGTDEKIPAIEIEILSQSQEQTCVLIFCQKQQQERVEQRLRGIGFAKPTVFTSMIPAERIARHQRKMEAARQEIILREQIIRNYETQREDFRFLVDYYTMRLEKYEILEKVRQGKRVFMVTGYLPHEKAKETEKELVQYHGAAVEIRETDEADDVPVLLQNNAFSAPVETVLETYSLPGRGEVDPTGVMAIFYYILFGLMLSDAAYGILVVLICGGLLWRFRDMRSGLKKSLTMFFYCGISTTFWGIMFGSYFGDAITIVSDVFFHHPITIPPLWFAPVENPMRMLLFSMAFGTIHVFGGLGMRLYQCIKEKDYTAAFFDVICWYLVVGGGIVFLLSAPMFSQMVGLHFVLPATVGTGAGICAGIGAFGIVLFGGRSSKNPAKRVAKGLYELYGVTSYLSDILSYSRLLALGLATGVIAQVFNKMGSMFGDGILGFLLFLIVFLVGHALNIAINLLGAYVHTNRLQFVEFFGKFYEGGGRKYTPFAVNTKYYQLEEEK